MTAVAGIRAARERRIIAPTDTVLAVVTGNGLKDIRTAMQTVGQPHSVEPDIREFENTVLPMLEE